ncbi:hypothetical protein HT031_004545 [Scenedesmus sp. PABB004]|nr:hypothetical protein HT031_004545 [Scenedesmus sp. PABB004]
MRARAAAPVGGLLLLLLLAQRASAARTLSQAPRDPFARDDALLAQPDVGLRIEGRGDLGGALEGLLGALNALAASVPRLGSLAQSRTAARGAFEAQRRETSAFIATSPLNSNATATGGAASNSTGRSAAAVDTRAASVTKGVLNDDDTDGAVCMLRARAPRAPRAPPPARAARPPAPAAKDLGAAAGVQGASVASGGAAGGAGGSQLRGTAETLAGEKLGGDRDVGSLAIGERDGGIGSAALFQRGIGEERGDACARAPRTRSALARRAASDRPGPPRRVAAPPAGERVSARLHSAALGAVAPSDQRGKGGDKGGALPPPPPLDGGGPANFGAGVTFASVDAEDLPKPGFSSTADFGAPANTLASTIAAGTANRYGYTNSQLNAAAATARGTKRAKAAVQGGEVGTGFQIGTSTAAARTFLTKAKEAPKEKGDKGDKGGKGKGGNTAGHGDKGSTAGGKASDARKP